MKIALCTPSLSPHGGSNSYLQHLARALEACGHTITRWKLAKDAAAYDGGGVWAIRSDKGLVDGGKAPVLVPGVDIIKWHELWQHHDLVHLTNPHSICMGYKEVLDKPPGSMVVTLHDAGEVAFNEGSGAIETLMRNADRIFFIGEPWMQSFRNERRIPIADFDAKARYFPHPYIRSATTPTGLTEADLDHAERDPRHIICTSAWRWNKGIPLAVEVAGELAPDGYHTHFWSGNKDAQLASFVQTQPGWPSCKDEGAWRWADAPKVYGPAAYLLNMTSFGPTDGMRTEYPILEAWEYGVTPVVRSTWAWDHGKGRQPEGAPVKGVDCRVGDTAAELAHQIKTFGPCRPEVMDAALKPHETVGLRIAAEYAEVVGHA